MKEAYFFTEEMCVGYHGKPLIEKINITLAKGEILTLIGPNGAGKSTVLKSIAGQLELLGGTVYLDGELFPKMSGTKRAQKMSVMLTDKIRTEMMTCEDVAATGRYPYTGRFGMLSGTDHRIVEEAMELVQVTAIRDQDFTKISDGQKQRVMLARALCQEPEILILDEPTSYLDVKYKLEFLSILQEMRKKKELTVILSLHELELAERISDRILCIRDGYVEKAGAPEEIFKPEHIRRLFGIEKGSFDEENGTMELEPPEGEAKIFVIAGNGTGRSVYRRLQREGRAFATGILFQNDLDYPAAKALAAETFSTEAFEPAAEQLLAAAKCRMDACEQVICCRESFGSLEAANRELAEYAKRKGKIYGSGQRKG